MGLHSFYLKADWPGGRNSEGFIDAGNLKTKVSIPKEMDGPGIGTNPDEMLLGAAATCYIITLAALIERAKLPLEFMSLESEGVVDVTYGIFTYKTITHRPTVTLSDTATEREHRKLEKLVYRADETCMISRAIKGNVDVQVEPVLK